MNLCSRCPERHYKAIRNVRTAIKSPCPGILTAIYIAHNRTEQWAPASSWHRVILNRNILPLLFLLCLLYCFLLYNWLASDVRMCSGKYYEIFVQKIPTFFYTAILSIAVAQKWYCQEHTYYSVSSIRSWRKRDDIFKKIPIYYICLSSINCWRTRWIDQQQQSVAGANLATTQQSAFETLLIIAWQSHIPLEVHPRCVCGDKYIYGIKLGYFFMRFWKMDGEIVDQYIRNDSLERRWKRLIKHCSLYCDF